MAAIKPANVLYISSKALKQTRQVVFDEEKASEVASASVRVSGTDGDAQNVLDKSLHDYKFEASKRVSSTEDDSAKMLARRKEMRNEKAVRLVQRKREYEKVKNTRLRPRIGAWRNFELPRDITWRRRL